MAYKKMPDISSYDGKVDFKVLKTETPAVILRVGVRGYGTEGTLKLDEKFQNNIKEAAANKIPLGVYFYTQAVNEKEAIAEANFVLKYIKGYKLKLPVYFDVEFAEKDGKPVGRLYNAKLSKAIQTKLCNAFCKVIAAAGYRTGIYAGTNFALDHLNINDLKQHSIWIADYRGANPSKYFKNIKIDIWQYGKGHYKGVKGRSYSDDNYLLNESIIEKDKVIQPVKPEPKPTPTPEKPKVQYFKKYTGKSNSLVDALKSLKIDSSFSYRKKIAKANGIKTYLGTAKQNTTLLNLLKKGKLIKP